MAETRGLVQKVTVYTLPNGQGACLWVGQSPDFATLFLLTMNDTDTDAMKAVKTSIVSSVVSALVGRLGVAVSHDLGKLISLTFDGSSLYS